MRNPIAAKHVIVTILLRRKTIRLRHHLLFFRLLGATHRDSLLVIRNNSI